MNATRLSLMLRTSRFCHNQFDAGSLSEIHINDLYWSCYQLTACLRIRLTSYHSKTVELPITTTVILLSSRPHQLSTIHIDSENASLDRKLCTTRKPSLIQAWPACYQSRIGLIVLPECISVKAFSKSSDLLMLDQSMETQFKEPLTG